MEWKTINENENYMININGKIKSKLTGKILKPAISRCGYYTVALMKDKKQRTHYIHRLLANNFIKNPNNYSDVNHIDGNKLNNNINNLEWCSHQQNIVHAYKTKLIHQPRGKSHPLSKKILQYNLLTGEITYWDSLIDVERKKGYSTGSIHYALQEVGRTYKNCHWEYV